MTRRMIVPLDGLFVNELRCSSNAAIKSKFCLLFSRHSKTKDGNQTLTTSSILNKQLQTYKLGAACKQSQATCV